MAMSMTPEILSVIERDAVRALVQHLADFGCSKADDGERLLMAAAGGHKRCFVDAKREKPRLSIGQLEKSKGAPVGRLPAHTNDR